MRATSIAALLLLAASCTGNDAVVYTPTGASAWNDGYPAAITAIPAGAPSGTLEVASFGLVELAPAEMAPITTLHVRIAATNNASERPWNVDLAGATVRAGDSEARTLLANSDLATLPIVLVSRGESRTIDLYFAAPPGVREEEDLGEWDFRISIAAPGKAVPAQAHFARREPTEVAGPRKEAARVAGWGSRWWADPGHPWPTFHHRPGVLTPKAPAQAAVSRLPRWQRAAPPWSAQR